MEELKAREAEAADLRLRCSVLEERLRQRGSKGDSSSQGQDEARALPTPDLAGAAAGRPRLASDASVESSASAMSSATATAEPGGKRSLFHVRALLFPRRALLLTPRLFPSSPPPPSSQRMGSKSRRRTEQHAKELQAIANAMADKLSDKVGGSRPRAVGRV